MSPPTSIDGTDITGATIDGQDVQEITVDGDVVFSAGPKAIGHWPGDEGSGSVLADNIGNNDFTLNGPNWITESSFTANTGIEINNNTAIATTQQPSEFTWIIRARPGNLGSFSPYNRTIISHGGQPVIAYQAQGGPNSEELFFSTNQGVLSTFFSQSTFEFNTWIFAARVSNAEISFKMFDDTKTEVVDLSASGGSATYDSSTTILGDDGSGSRHWIGSIDPNWYQFDFALSDSQLVNFINSNY